MKQEVNGNRSTLTRSAARTLRSLRAWPCLLVSLILVRTWDLHVFQQAFLIGSFGGMPALHSLFPLLPLAPLPLWLLLTLVEMMTYLLSALLPGLSRMIFSQKRYMVVLTGLLALGALLLLFELVQMGNDGGPVGPLFWLGVLFMGFGLGGLRIELGRFCGFLGMKPTMLFSLTGMLGAAALFPLLSEVLGANLWMLTIVVPTVGSILLIRERTRAPQARLSGQKPDKEKLKVPVKFIATSLVQGTCYGMSFCLLFFSPVFSFALPISVGGMILAALLAAGAMIFMHYGFNTLIYRIGFPLVGMGFVIIGVFSPGFAVGVTLAIAGFFFLELILWTLGAFLIKNKSIPSGWTIHLPHFALAGGKCLGGLLVITGGEAMAPWAVVQPQWCIVAFLVLFAALIMTNNVNIRHGWGFMGSNDADDFEERIEACKLVAQDAGLTKKEYETLLLLAQGQGRKDIAGSLVVSPNTVKTHTLNIYRKLDIHSQVELTELIRLYERSFGNTASPAQLANKPPDVLDTTIH